MKSQFIPILRNVAGGGIGAILVLVCSRFLTGTWRWDLALGPVIGMLVALLCIAAWQSMRGSKEQNPSPDK